MVAKKTEKSQSEVSASKITAGAIWKFSVRIQPLQSVNESWGSRIREQRRERTLREFCEIRVSNALAHADEHRHRRGTFSASNCLR